MLRTSSTSAVLPGHFHLPCPRVWELADDILTVLDGRGFLGAQSVGKGTVASGDPPIRLEISGSDELALRSNEAAETS